MSTQNKINDLFAGVIRTISSKSGFNYADVINTWKSKQNQQMLFEYIKNNVYLEKDSRNYSRQTVNTSLAKSDHINIENIPKSHFSEETSIENDSLQRLHSCSDNCRPHKQKMQEPCSAEVICEDSPNNTTRKQETPPMCNQSELNSYENNIPEINLRKSSGIAIDTSELDCFLRLMKKKHDLGYM